MNLTEPDSVLLGEAAYVRIRDDIVSCRLAPGSRLTERGLAAQTGFGVSPIRDALTRLDHEGLVRTLPRKGYQVKPLTIKAVNDLFDFWVIIASEVARRGVVNLTTDRIDRILAGVDAIEKLITEDEPPQVIAHRMQEISNMVFTTVAEATDNEYMISTCSRLSGEIARVWTLVIDSELMDHAEPAIRLLDWKDVLLQRKGDVFAEHARRYIEQSHNRVLRTLVRWPSVVATEVVPLRPPQ